MREDHVARLAGHLDNSELDFAELGGARHESFYAIDFFIPRTQFLDPWTCANESLARIGRAQLFPCVLLKQIAHEQMRPGDKQSAGSSRLQIRETGEDAHGE